MKLYQKKENNIQYKSKIISLLDKLQPYNTKQLESLINKNNNVNSLNYNSNLIELITKYINLVQSKKLIDRNTFFKRISENFNDYNTDNTNIYFNEIRE